jgi:hypothetical protein
VTHSTITLVKILFSLVYIAFALSRRASTVSNGGGEEEEDGEEEKKKPEFLEPAPKRRHIESIAKNLSGRL